MGFSKLIQILLISVLAVLFLNSANAMPMAGQGIYVGADGSLGYYEYSTYSDNYYFGHYPNTYYDGYYTDLVYYDNYYYYPAYDTYYYPSGTAYYNYYANGYYPYAGYMVPDGYYMYPPVMPVDGYYGYPPAIVPDFYGGYDVVADFIVPVYAYLDYFIPYGGYGYGGYGYANYGYPSGAYSGFEGDAGTVTIEKNFKPKPVEAEPEEDNFNHYFVEQNYYGYADPPEEDSKPDYIVRTEEKSTNTFVFIPEEYRLAEDEAEPEETEELVLQFAEAEMTSPGCNAINLVPVSVDVQANGESKAVFYLENNSFEDFYVDRFNVYSLSPAIEVYEDIFDSKIMASGTGTLTARFYANADASNTGAFLQVYGEFKNGKSCGFNEIKEQFSIYVLPGSQKADCQDFELSVPNKVLPEDEKLAFTASNPTDKAARILLSGDGLTLNPRVVEVPAQTFMEKEVYFEGQGESIRYQVLMEGCAFNDKITYFYQDKGEVKLMSYSANVKLTEDNKVYITLKNTSAMAKQINLALLELPPGFEVEDKIVSLQPFETRTVELEVDFTESADAVQFDSKLVISFAGSRIEKEIPVSLNSDDIAMRAEVEEMVNGNYGVKVTLTNHTANRVQGQLSLPGNAFKVRGETDLVLDAGQTKTIVLSVTPANSLKKGQFVPIKFEQANGQAYLTYAKFAPLQGAVATAFLSLTSSAAILGGFIVLLVLAVYFAREKGLFEKVGFAFPEKGKMPKNVDEDDYF